MEERVILGVDPGTRVTGYALISSRNKGLKIIDFGCIKPPVHLPLSKRYLIIFNAIEALIVKHHPKVVAIETQFMGKNAQSALKLGMARGSVVLAAERNGVEVCEYTPRKAKLAITGTGSASKYQVQKMTQMLFSLPGLPQPQDATDALAIAVCCAHDIRFSAEGSFNRRGLCTNSFGGS